MRIVVLLILTVSIQAIAVSAAGAATRAFHAIDQTVLAQRAVLQAARCAGGWSRTL